jgi:tetratricopeptide (TPR) repeat protein
MWDYFKNFVRRYFSRLWAVAAIVALITWIALLLLLENGQPIKVLSRYYIIQSHWFVFLTVTAVIFFVPLFQNFILPLVRKPARGRFVILVANFQPLSDDSKKAAKIFPALLSRKLRGIKDPTMKVIRIDETIRGNTADEERENARKMGLRKKARLVIFGSVRCDEGAGGDCTDKFKYKPKMLLTEGPIIQDLKNGIFVSSNDYIDNTKSRDATEIAHTLKFIVGLKMLAFRYYEASARMLESIKDKDSEEYFFEATALGLLGRYEESNDAFAKAIELDPTYAAAYCDKAAALNNLCRYKEAITACDKAIELDPGLAFAYIIKGVALYYLGKPTEAVNAYDTAVKFDPKFADTYYNMSKALLKLGKYEKAIAACDKVLRLRPKDARAYSNKGTALNELGKYEKAIAAYDKAIELDPKLEHAHRYKGAVLINLGRYEDAIAECDRAIELNPKSSRAYLTKGIALALLEETARKGPH